MVKNSVLNKNSKKPNDKRTHVVIDTNKNDLALVRLTTKKSNSTRLKHYKDGNSYFKHFVEIEDINHNPLTLNDNITANHKNMDLNDDNVKYIISTISKSKEKEQFNLKINKFRNRYKKNPISKKISVKSNKKK